MQVLDMPSIKRRICPLPLDTKPGLVTASMNRMWWERQCVISKVQRKRTERLLPASFGMLAPGAFSGHISGGVTTRKESCRRVPAVPAPVIGVFPAPQTLIR